MIKKGTLYSEVSKSKNGSLHEQSKTIATGDEEETSLRYKKLCYENEKLRRDLWELNESINKKIEKVKFPAVKKSVSLDLGSKPPSSTKLIMCRSFKKIVRKCDQTNTDV